MSYTISVNAVSKVDKESFGIIIGQGDRIKLLLNESGYAALATNDVIRFTPDEYELFIQDEEYDRLLKAE